MTVKKADNLLRGDRTPTFVDRETGAAECSISPATWDEWVKAGTLPPAEPGFPESSPRWRWSTVLRKLSGDTGSGTLTAIAGAANIGKTQGKRREAA